MMIAFITIKSGWTSTLDWGSMHTHNGGVRWILGILYVDYCVSRGLTVTQDMYPHFCKRWSNLTILVSDSTPWWIWKLLCHPSKKRQTKLTLLSSLSPISSAMTSTTPTPPSAAHQLNCLTFGNPVSSHTFSSTSATYQMRHNLRHYRLASTSHSAPPCIFMDIQQRYFLSHTYFRHVLPPCTSRRICNLHNSDSGCAPPPNHNPVFLLVFMAATAASSAFGYAWRPAECNRTGGSTAERPELPYATQRNPLQAT